MTILLAGGSIRRSIGGRGSIRASAPIMVAKFVVSDETAASGEPTMMLMQSYEQFIDDYDFVV